MKIGIIGAGAIGGLYGAVLSETGHDVYLIDIFKEHIDAINSKGLTILHGDEKKVYTNLKAFTDGREIGEELDLVIVLVKTYITEIAMEQNKDLFGDNTIVLTLQNGIGNIEKIAAFIDESKIVAGNTSTAGYIEEPGLILHTGSGGTVIGEIDGNVTDRIKEIQRMFDHEKLGESKVSENVMSLIWEKLIGNCGINPLGALTGLRNGELVENEETSNLQDKIAEECLMVAKRAGIPLRFTDSSIIKDLARKTAPNQTSMLVDVLNKRRTEIMAINGGVVEKAKELGLEVPINEMLVNLVLAKEKSYLTK